LIAAAAFGCIRCSGPGDGPEFVCTTSQSLYALLPTVWRITEIPVCWEAEAMNTVSESDRQLVRAAIADSWETALSDTSAVPPSDYVHFTGWDACDSDPVAAANGIHITTFTGDPHTVAIGNQLAGVPDGMQLNFTFQSWSPSCLDVDPTNPADTDQVRKHCVYAIAVHEFGHALGLVHEQNRPDTPTTCTESKQTSPNGDFTIGLWDQQSVMNYCNPNWNNSGILSPTDAGGIRTMYYPAAANGYCGKQVIPVPSATPSGGSS
jgi:hypothetical protein